MCFVGHGNNFRKAVYMLHSAQSCLLSAEFYCLLIVSIIFLTDTADWMQGKILHRIYVEYLHWILLLSFFPFRGEILFLLWCYIFFFFLFFWAIPVTMIQYLFSLFTIVIWRHLNIHLFCEKFRLSTIDNVRITLSVLFLFFWVQE